MPELSPTYRNLLKLLRFSLYEPAGKMSSLRSPLSDRQWYKMIEEAEKQTVTGLLFSAISVLPEYQMPLESVLANWLAMAHRDAKKYSAMSAVLSRLLGVLDNAGLHPVLQKGHAAARFYTAPQLRASGDIDLWFAGSDRSRADELIRQAGYKVIATPDNASCYSVNHIEVEHHSMLIDINNPFHAGIVNEICKDNPPSRVELSSGIVAHVPAPIVELLMMNVHILKHCLGVGIGLRQFCDYSLAWRHLTAVTSPAGPVDADGYFELCRRLGIMRWTRALHRFINRYLPATDGDAVTAVPGRNDDVTVQRIFTLVCEGGNFGKFHHGRQINVKRTMMRRKFHTMSAFITNRSFVYHLAPVEAFWTFSRLLWGQIH